MAGSIHIAICDDEILILPYLSANIQNAFQLWGFQPKLYPFSSGGDLLAQVIQGVKFDVAFLDIDMPELDGISLARRLSDLAPDTVCIFASAKEERVFDALYTHPFGFIRKSAFQSDLKAVAADVAKRLEPPEGPTFTFRDDLDKPHTVALDRTVYIEAQDKYLRVVTGDGCDLVRYTLSRLEQDLSGNRFLRIHKSYLVNYRFIHQLKAGGIVLEDGQTLPLSRYRAAEVRKQFIDYSRQP